MTYKASWGIVFYTDARGASPVQEFIQKLPKPERAKVIWVIDLLAEYGIHLTMPHSRPIVQDLWELRAGTGRIFYFTLEGRRFVLLHGYVKKTQRTPAREIEIALRRMHEYKERSI